MNKFKQNEIKAKAMTGVARQIAYQIESAQNSYESYMERALADVGEGGEVDPDSYWYQEALEEQERLNYWNEFAALLEKKLLK